MEILVWLELLLIQFEEPFHSLHAADGSMKVRH